MELKKMKLLIFVVVINKIKMEEIFCLFCSVLVTKSINCRGRQTSFTQLSGDFFFPFILAMSQKKCHSIRCLFSQKDQMQKLGKYSGFSFSLSIFFILSTWIIFSHSE